MDKLSQHPLTVLVIWAIFTALGLWSGLTGLEIISLGLGALLALVSIPPQLIRLYREYKRLQITDEVEDVLQNPDRKIDKETRDELREIIG